MSTGQLQKPEEMRGLVVNGERAPSSPAWGCESGLPPPLPVFEGPPPDRSVPKWVSPWGRKNRRQPDKKPAAVPVRLSEKQKAVRSPQGSTPPVSRSRSGRTHPRPQPIMAPAPPQSVSAAACFLLRVSVLKHLSAQPLLLFVLCDLMYLSPCFSNASSLHLRDLFPWMPH